MRVSALGADPQSELLFERSMRNAPKGQADVPFCQAGARTVEYRPSEFLILGDVQVGSGLNAPREVSGANRWRDPMRFGKVWRLACGTTLLCSLGAGAPATAQTPAPGQGKPNILFIMGDDIGLYQPSIYHRGLMVGETPNIDRIGSEGAVFNHYYAEQSCTAGRNAFFTGMHPLRTGMIPPQLPGSPSGCPAVAGGSCR